MRHGRTHFDIVRHKTKKAKADKYNPKETNKLEISQPQIISTTAIWRHHMRQETLVIPLKHSSVYYDAKKDRAVVRPATPQNVQKYLESMDLDFSKYHKYKNRKQRLKDLKNITEVHKFHYSTGN